MLSQRHIRGEDCAVDREKWQVVKLIRRIMEERAAHFNCQVQSIVELQGDTFALDILAKTIRVEIDGGMMLDDGSRRRTMGGVYIKLAKDEMTPEQKREWTQLSKAKLKAQIEWQKAHNIALAKKAALEAAAAEQGVTPEMVEVVHPPAPEAQKPKNGKAAKPAA